LTFATIGTILERVVKTGKGEGRPGIEDVFWPVDTCYTDPRISHFPSIPVDV
jgi:hypothetical protein